MHDVQDEVRHHHGSPSWPDDPFIVFLDGELSAASLASIQKFVERVAMWAVGENWRPFGDAKDLTQEAMIKVLAGIAKVEMRGAAQLKKWLRTVVLNTFFDLLRRQKNRTADQMQDDVEAGAVVVELESHAQQNVLIRELMEDLSESERELVWRHYAAEETIVEIAAGTPDLTVPRVKHALAQAVRKMVRRSLRKKLV